MRMINIHGEHFSQVKTELGARSSEVARLRVVSRHILRTVHRWRLERGGPDPLTSWAPDTLSCHVLLALDELVAALKCQSLRCYLHPRCNVMLQCVRGDSIWGEKWRRVLVRRTKRSFFFSFSLSFFFLPLSSIYTIIQSIISTREDTRANETRDRLVSMEILN